MSKPNKAIEKLRRMLFEHGIPHIDKGDMTLWGQPVDRVTGNRIGVYHSRATAMGDDRLYLEMQLVTPEQAIAATIGETCTMELLPFEPSGYIQPMRCTACGHKTYAQLASYCPHCGRRVVE